MSQYDLTDDNITEEMKTSLYGIPYIDFKKMEGKVKKYVRTAV